MGSWTYDPSTDAGKIRLLIGDTVSSDPQLTDEEIDVLLTLETSVRRAAAAACRALAARFARQVDKAVGDLKLFMSQRYDHYVTLEEKILGAGAAASPYAIPSAGGVYTADRDEYEDNEALVQPQFKIGMHDYESE